MNSTNIILLVVYIDDIVIIGDVGKVIFAKNSFSMATFKLIILGN